jgi:O-antigen ligase
LILTTPARSRFFAFHQALIDLIILIAPIGLFYFSAARVLIWFFFLLSLVSLYQHRVEPWLLRNAGLYCLALFLGALFTLHPDLAIDGVRRIAMGFCMFVPGLVIGRRLRERPLGVVSLLPVLALEVAHLFAPSDYDGRFFFGFHDNPNNAGHGFAFALIILGVAYASVCDHSEAGWIGGRRWWYRLLWSFTVSLVAVLLLISNYRAGWLGVVLFGLILLLWATRISARLRFLMAFAFSAGAVVVMRFRDYKGLGFASSMHERLVLWGRTLAAWWQQFPLFGSGFRSFEVMADNYVGGVVARPYRFPHNMVIEILFSSGLYGLAATIVFLVAQGRGLLLAGLRFNRWLPKAALLAIVSMLVMGQFGIHFASFDYVGAVSILFGILVAQLPAAEPAEVPVPQLRFESAHGRSR